MKIQFNYLTTFIWLIVWIAGAVVAKGFWSTFFTITTGGFWSMYLILETLLTKYNFI